MKEISFFFLIVVPLNCSVINYFFIGGKMFRSNQFFPNCVLRSSDNWHESQVDACLLKMKILGPSTYRVSLLSQTNLPILAVL